MKKKQTQLLLLAAALVVLIGVLLLLRRGPAADESGESSSAPEPVSYLLGGIPQPEVRKVEIQSGGESFTIEPTGEGGDNSTFTIVGLEADTLNQTLLRSVITNVSSLEAKSTIAAGDDLAPYGLDQPRATLAVTFPTGTQTLEVGAETPGQEGTYVRKDGKVYLSETTKLNTILGGKLSFVNRTLSPGNNQTTDFETLTLSGTAYPEPVSIQRAGEDAATSYTGLAAYRITQPLETAADSTAIADLRTVFGLAASATVAQTPFQSEEAAAYGLDQPYLQVEAEPHNTGEEETPYPAFTLLFSQPDDEGNVYAQTSQSGYVFQLPAASIAPLTQGLFAYQDKLAITPQIDTVSEVVVTTPSGDRVFQLEGTGDDLQVTANGETLDTANYRQFYQSLLAARYDSEIPTDPEQETPNPDEVPAEGESPSEEASASSEAAPPELDGELLLQYTYRYRDGRAEDVVTFRKGPPRKTVLRLNDGPSYYGQSVYVDRILEDLPKVLAGQEVKSYL